ncbi:MAG: hypothetical protein ACJA0V_003741 [Planctomycetota bacterium]
MNLIAHGARSVWFGRLADPSEFTSPARGEYALLLAVGDDVVETDDQVALSESIVRSGCRHAVCFGRTSSTWDDSIDWIGVKDEVDGHPSPFVQTSWFDSDPIEDAVDFFADHAIFSDWSTTNYVVAVVAASDGFTQQVLRAVRDRFC